MQESDAEAAAVAPVIVEIESSPPDAAAVSSASPASGNAASPRRPRRNNRGAKQSQAKRRLEAMATSVDHKLAAAFTLILVLYALITFGTWMSLET